MFGFNKKANAKTYEKKHTHTSHTNKPVTETKPVWTVDHITDKKNVERAVGILNGTIVPTMADHEFYRQEASDIIGRLNYIKRGLNSDKPFMRWMEDDCIEASCIYELFGMTFRKALFMNDAEAAKKRASGDRLICISSDNAIVGYFGGRNYDRHCKEYGFPAIKECAYLDIRNGMKPFTNWLW